MSDDGEAGRMPPQHRARRRRGGKGTGPSPTKLFPGLTFRPPVSGRRASLVDLTGLRPGLAEEAARMIWEDCEQGVAYRSGGAIIDVTQTLARLDEFLLVHDPMRRIDSFMKVREADVDAFDVWLHEVRYPAGSVSPYARISSFVVFLSRALEKGRAPEVLVGRLRFASKWHDLVSTTPRDAYDDLTLANLRRLAGEDALRVISRLEEGRRMATQGRVPEQHGWEDKCNLAWSLVNGGMVAPQEFRRLNHLYARREMTFAQVLDHVFPGIADSVPFLVLLADATGLPIESVRELKADCMVSPDRESSRLRYIKRRRTGSDDPQFQVYPTQEPFSVGWLVERVLFVTAAARRSLGYGEREGPLFLGRVGPTIKALNITENAIKAWLDKNPVVSDADGNTLKVLQLSRIRKSYKAAEYVGGGGRLSEIRDDHSVEVFAQHYGNIPFLKGRHDEAIAAGLWEAHDAALPRAPLVLTRAEEARLAAEPADFAARFGTTVEKVREIAAGTSGVWTSDCLDFLDSPWAEKGKPCGAPVFGCLDCRNAVITASKLPALLRLLNHVVGRRQEMRIDEWKRNYGFLFVRLGQAIQLFGREDLEAAKAEVEDDLGRDWIVAQLAYRMDGA